MPALVGGEGISGALSGVAAAAAAAAASAVAPAGAAGDPGLVEILKGMLRELIALRLRDPILVMLVSGDARGVYAVSCTIPLVLHARRAHSPPTHRSQHSARATHTHHAHASHTPTNAPRPTHPQHARALESFSRFVAVHGDMLVPLVQASFDCLQVRGTRAACFPHLGGVPSCSFGSPAECNRPTNRPHPSIRIRSSLSSRTASCRRRPRCRSSGRRRRWPGRQWQRSVDRFGGVCLDSAAQSLNLKASSTLSTSRPQNPTPHPQHPHPPAHTTQLPQPGPPQQRQGGARRVPPPPAAAGRQNTAALGPGEL
jgi:hypothetical protein